MFTRIGQLFSQLSGFAMANPKLKPMFAVAPVVIAQQSLPKEQQPEETVSPSITTTAPSRFQQMFNHKSAWTSRSVVNDSKNTVESDVDSEGDKATWSGDWHRSILRGVFAGIAVPAVTIPFIQVETNISIKRGFKVAWETTLEKPWKGYQFSALSNTARAFLLFNSTSYANDYLKQYNLGSTATKAYACSLAAIAEGGVMSFRAPIMQKLHTDQSKGYREIFRDITSKEGSREFYKHWKVTLVSGTVRNITFWPLWSIVVDQMEKQLLVSKQQETAIKWWEEFMIGASAAVIVSPAGYPAHGVMRRLNDSKNIPGNPFVAIKDDFKMAWKQHKKEHKEKKIPLWKYVPKHVYKGFIPASVVILPLMMGTTNLSKHAADIIYDHGASPTLFKPKRNEVHVQAREEDENAILYRMI